MNPWYALRWPGGPRVLGHCRAGHGLRFAGRVTVRSWNGRLLSRAAYTCAPCGARVIRALTAAELPLRGEVAAE